MNIESLTSNPLLKNMLLKQLKKAWKENGLTLIAIVPDEKNPDELDFKIYTEKMVILPETDYLQTLQLLSDL